MSNIVYYSSEFGALYNMMTRCIDIFAYELKGEILTIILSKKQLRLVEFN